MTTLRHVQIAGPNFPRWRDEARALLLQDVPPEQVLWDEGGVLFDSVAELTENAPTVTKTPFTIPRAFLPMAMRVAFHRDISKWSLLYRTLWRLTHHEPRLLEVLVDDDVRQLYEMDKAVRRDAHKMHAFVRFRKVQDEQGDHYIAWHRPDHLIVRFVAGFFRERFGVQRWTILTPDESVSWDCEKISFGPGVPKRLAPQADEIESVWKTYYASIFNPARVKVRAMKKEMPVKHWATLPEAELIDELLREAPKRVAEMVKRSAANARPATRPSPHSRAKIETASSENTVNQNADCEVTGSAKSFIPTTLELPVLAKAAQGCKGCSIYCNATQAVFGEGPSDALIVMVGEQPGDSEDLEGRPFIGPAGQLLNDVMERVGLPRAEVYLTNAVKHFKFEPRGKRRIHAKPSAREVAACRPWLETELAIVKPRMLVCLGSTAAQSLLGRDFRITKTRGEVMQSSWAPWTIATLHPSALLRIPDPALREQAMVDFESDLRKIAKQLEQEKQR